MENENSSDIENLNCNNSKNDQLNEKEFDLETEEKICWSPRFEFDAPRYTNFTSKKYRETAKLLNKLVLNKDDEDCKYSGSGSDSESELELDTKETFYELDMNMVGSSDSDDIDEWFNRFHPLHEPLRPMTPPGPLISPERSFFKLGSQSLRASPLKLDFSADKPMQIHSPRGRELNTPSKGPNTRIGLRSKPARVLKGGNNNSIDSVDNLSNNCVAGGNGNNSSIHSSPSSLKRTNFAPNNTNRSPVRLNYNSPVRLQQQQQQNNSPTRLQPQNYSPTRSNNSPIVRSSPIKSLMTPTRLSISSTTSSITLSVSSLTKTFYKTDTETNTDTNNVNSLTQQQLLEQSTLSSPLKMKTKFSEGTSSPLRKAVGILQLEDASNNPRKRVNETLQDSNKKLRRSVNAELEDIKKLLNQHNNRIRPNKKK